MISSDCTWKAVFLCLFVLFQARQVFVDGRRYDTCITHDDRQGVCVAQRYCREASTQKLADCGSGHYCCPIPTSLRSAQPQSASSESPSETATTFIPFDDRERRRTEGERSENGRRRTDDDRRSTDNDNRRVGDDRPRTGIDSSRTDNARPRTDIGRPRTGGPYSAKPFPDTDRSRTDDSRRSDSDRPQTFDRPRSDDRTRTDDRPRSDSDRPRTFDRPRSDGDIPRTADRPRSDDRTGNDNRPRSDNDRPRTFDQPRSDDDIPRSVDIPRSDYDRPRTADSPRIDDRPSPGRGRPLKDDIPRSDGDRPRTADSPRIDDRPRADRNRPTKDDIPRSNIDSPRTYDRPRSDSDRPRTDYGRPATADRPNSNNDRPRTDVNRVPPNTNVVPEIQVPRDVRENGVLSEEGMTFEEKDFKNSRIPSNTGRVKFENNVPEKEREESSWARGGDRGSSNNNPRETNPSSRERDSSDTRRPIHSSQSGNHGIQSDRLLQNNPVSTSNLNPSIDASRSRQPSGHGTRKVPGCGVKPYDMFIAGGRPSDTYDWPWMVAIFRRFQNSLPKEFQCGGSLLNQKYVLTAAHCFVKNFVVLPASSFVVRLGSNELATGEEYTVSELIVHNHTGSDFFNDIALLRLAAEVIVSDKIAPVCLPWPDLERVNLVGRYATVAGWGDTQFRSGASRVLHHVTVPIVSNDDCFSAYSRVKGAAFLARGTDHVICAGLEEGGKDACLGDSGGPLMLKVSDDRWVVVGIVSLGYKCAEPGYPGVYTRVSHYMSWIRSSMKKQ